MQTELPRDFLATLDGERADRILRSCVHCGFCNATCPTYQILGDELDGPRGRIYLIKDMLETRQADAVTQQHLDRCLTCRACETTCPSGVRYGELLEIGREFMEPRQPRRRTERWLRQALLTVVPRRRRFARWLALGRAFRWLLPKRLAAQLPPPPLALSPVHGPPADTFERRVLLLQGCVQSAATPAVNEALTALLNSRGIEVRTLDEEPCCGSLALHLGATDQARATFRASVAALQGHLDEVEAVVSTASGCGVTVKDYGRLLADEPAERQAAERVARQTLDVAELLNDIDTTWRGVEGYRRVAWHAPCSLQHGQRAATLVEGLLRSAGYELVPVADPHLCCGSAGTYSLLQPALSGQLRARKLDALQAAQPDIIATANVGCQLHLAGAADTPVVHWVELLR